MQILNSIAKLHKSVGISIFFILIFVGIRMSLKKTLKNKVAFEGWNS